MNHKVRIGTLVLALGLAAFLTGCANQSTYAGQRVRVARDFEIVETSTKRTLTSQEMAHLKAKVEDYLDQEGATENGDYYVKIFLGEEEGVREGEWVVVRYTREPAVRVSLLASYPAYYDSYHSTYAYDYYPFPHYGFSRLSFQYYDYPSYGYRHYPFSRRHHGRGHHGDRDGKPGGRPDRDRDDDRDPTPGDGRPSGALKPSFKPTFVPANVNRNRGNEAAPVFGARADGNVLTHFPEVRQRPRNRQITPGIATPQPAPLRSTDFSARQPITPARTTPENPATFRPNRIRTPVTGTVNAVPRLNRPERVSAPSVQRPTQTRERPSAPAANAPASPTREVRTTTVPRANPAAAFKPSAPRSQPAAAPAPAPARSEPAPSYRAPESRSDSDSSSSNQRVNSYDGGRPDRRR